jgi:hypothetical protein
MWRGGEAQSSLFSARQGALPTWRSGEAAMCGRQVHLLGDRVEPEDARAFSSTLSSSPALVS